LFGRTPDHTAKSSPHARKELVGVEGFDDVVVGSDEEPRDAVRRRRPLAREEDDGDLAAEGVA
jgi:hypothetical protein